MDRIARCSLVILMVSLFAGCEQAQQPEPFVPPPQPGGFSSEEEKIFQEAEALKYAIDQLDQQMEQHKQHSQAIGVEPHETADKQNQQ